MSLLDDIAERNRKALGPRLGKEIKLGGIQGFVADQVQHGFEAIDRNSSKSSRGATIIVLLLVALLVGGIYSAW
jgi:hypothetical protein